MQVENLKSNKPKVTIQDLAERANGTWAAMHDGLEGTAVHEAAIYSVYGQRTWYKR
jgi:hypothetical protein